MPKKPVLLGELKFGSKQEAKKHFSDILNRHPLGTKLSNSEFDDVMSLLLCHPKADEKIGSGVKSLKIDQGYNSSNRCFHIIRKDESIENFGIGKCIDGDHSPFYKFCIACRKTVESDLLEVKKKYFKENSDSEHKVICSLTKEKIEFNESHIDHREPFTFSSIVHFFIQANNINLNQIEYITQNNYGNEFKDNQLSQDFKSWHKKNAKIRIVKGEANLAKSHLGRIADTKADQNLK